MNVHSYCQTKVANLCGINQKLLAEALSQVSQVCTLTVYFHLFGQFMWMHSVRNFLTNFFSPQKSVKKSDNSNAADIGVYQDIQSATADPSGEMCS